MIRNIFYCHLIIDFIKCDINEIVTIAKKMKVSPELVLLCKIKYCLNKNFSDLHSELKSIDSTIWSNS